MAWSVILSGPDTSTPERVINNNFGRAGWYASGHPETMQVIEHQAIALFPVPGSGTAGSGVSAGPHCIDDRNGHCLGSDELQFT